MKKAPLEEGFLTADDTCNCDQVVTITGITQIAELVDGSVERRWLMTFEEFGFRTMVLSNEDARVLESSASSGMISQWVGRKIVLSVSRRLQVRVINDGVIRS